MKARGQLGNRVSRRREKSFCHWLMACRRVKRLCSSAPAPRRVSSFRLRRTSKGSASWRDDISATDASGRMKEAILFAHAFLKRDSPDRVVVISDGAFAGAEDYSRQARIFASSKSTADATTWASSASSCAGIPIVIPIRSHGAREKLHRKLGACSADFDLGEKTAGARVIDLEPDGRQVLIYPFESSPQGTLVARLEIDDDFATDNRAYLALSDAPPVRLLYVGPGNPFLSQSLPFFPHLQVNTAPEWDPNAASSHYDLVIFDQCPGASVDARKFYSHQHSRAEFALAGHGG